MPIKLADVIENSNSSYAVVDISNNDSSVKGVGIFTSENNRNTWGDSGTKGVQGYLNITRDANGIYLPYIYQSSTWGTSSNHHEIVTTPRIPDVFDPTDFTVVAAAAGQSIGQILHANEDTVTFAAYVNGSQLVRGVTLKHIIQAILSGIVQENIDGGFGTIASYGGSAGSGGNPADINGDGEVNVADLIAFLGLYGDQGPVTTTGPAISKIVYAANGINGVTNITSTTGSTVDYYDVVATSSSNATLTHVNSNDLTSTGDQLTTTIATGTDYTTFSDGSVLEVASGGGAPIGDFTLELASNWGYSWNGEGQGYLYVYVEVGRKVGGTYTNAVALVGAFVWGLGNPGLIDSSNNNLVLADNLDGFAYTNLDAVQINTISPLTYTAAGGTVEDYTLSLKDTFESITGETFWSPNTQEIRMRWGITYSTSSTGASFSISPQAWTVRAGTVPF